MRILFWGTPAYAVASLEALVAAGQHLVGVVTQPDRRRGRGGERMPSAVKARALELGLPVFSPERIRRDGECQRQLAALGADVYVVVAFGQILPAEVLRQPRLGCWNGHGSLLPRWRGAAPIHWALLEGDAETGVGIMAMEEGLDTGPVLIERCLTIGLLENASQLGDRLAALTGELLLEALPRIAAAGPGPEPERLERLAVCPQEQLQVQWQRVPSHARLLTKADYTIDWSCSALAIHRRVMGLHPGATTRWGSQRLKLLATEPLVRRLAASLSPEAASLAAHWGQPTDREPTPAPASSPAAPPAVPGGTVLAVAEDGGLGGLVVATAGCPLLVRLGQLEGRSPAEGRRLVQQLSAAVGDRLG